MKLRIDNLTRQDDQFGGVLNYRAEFYVFDLKEASKKVVYATDPAETILVSNNFANLAPIIEREAGKGLIALALEKAAALPAPVKLEGETAELNAVYFPAPTTALTISPSAATKGDAITLSWSSTNADKIESNFGAAEVSGSIVLNPDQTKEYWIIAYGDGKAAAKAAVQIYKLPVVEMFVELPDTPPDSALSEITISPNERATIKWRAEAIELIAKNGWVGEKPPVGEEIVAPSASSIFTLIAKNEVGKEVSKSVKVNIAI